MISKKHAVPCFKIFVLDVMRLNEKAIIGKFAALQYIKDGMIVGLGTGSTVYHTIVTIAEMIKNGQQIKGVATSKQTEKLAIEFGIPLLDIAEVEKIDIAIDGADEIDGDFFAIKGGGGALLREKVIAKAAKCFVVVVDSNKIKDQLGAFPLPVEVVPFGVGFTEKYIQELGCSTALRMHNGQPYLTDNGNYIIDCNFSSINHPEQLENDLNEMTGVVENGLFINMVHQVVTVKDEKKVVILKKEELA